MTTSWFPSVRADSVGWITEEQMVEVDRVMIEDLGIVLVQMMENAGRNLARVVLDTYRPGSVAVACGSGGNGGGGMVAARHLANAGVDVTVTTTRTGDKLGGVPRLQFEILQRMGVRQGTELADADVAIDAVIGYSLRGAPAGRSNALIEALNEQAVVVSLDSPSGLNVTTGDTPGNFVTADTTMTLALPKIGLRNHPAVNQLLIADISVPRSVTEALGGAPNFAASPILGVI
jgi:NAD(P)H-hydrate epimerase